MGTKIDESVKYLTAMRKTYQKIEQIAREGINETRCEEIVRIIDGKA